MRREISYFIGVSTLLGSLAMPVTSYSAGITSRTTETEEDANWEDRSSRNNPKAGEYAKKALNYSTGGGLEKVEKFSDGYRKFRKETGREAGTGSTTDDHDREDREKQRR